MKIFLICLFLIATVFAAPQVPYDYIPIGRGARRDAPAAHPSGISLTYEKLFPSRRKWIDTPVDLYQRN